MNPQNWSNSDPQKCLGALQGDGDIDDIEDLDNMVEDAEEEKFLHLKVCCCWNLWNSLCKIACLYSR